MLLLLSEKRQQTFCIVPLYYSENKCKLDDNLYIYALVCSLKDGQYVCLAFSSKGEPPLEKVKQFQ